MILRKQVIWFYLSNIIASSFCAVSVSKVTVRTPKEGDIGLIFDVNVVNTASDKKQMFDFRIRSDGECCVNASTSGSTFKAGRVLGGSFGHIEPGVMKTVSLIWPTTAVFNRVGHCNVIISSTNVKNEEMEFTQRIPFDTRFQTIDSTGHSFTRRSNYVDCKNWDLNYFNNCAPLNCEEKYLGRRSFFNSTTKQCEEVPKCLESGQIYDIYANECSSLRSKLTVQDIDDIRRGNPKNTMELKSRSRELEYPEFEEPQLPMEPRSIGDEMISILGVIFATILLYTLVCFAIFLAVNKISERSSRRSFG